MQDGIARVARGGQLLIERLEATLARDRVGILLECALRNVGRTRRRRLSIEGDLDVEGRTAFGDLVANELGQRLAVFRPSTASRDRDETPKRDEAVPRFPAPTCAAAVIVEQLLLVGREVRDGIAETTRDARELLIE